LLHSELMIKFHLYRSLAYITLKCSA